MTSHAVGGKPNVLLAALQKATAAATDANAADRACATAVNYAYQSVMTHFDDLGSKIAKGMHAEFAKSKQWYAEGKGNVLHAGISMDFPLGPFKFARMRFAGKDRAADYDAPKDRVTLLVCVADFYLDVPQPNTPHELDEILDDRATDVAWTKAQQVAAAMTYADKYNASASPMRDAAKTEVEAQLKQYFGASEVRTGFDCSGGTCWLKVQMTVPGYDDALIAAAKELRNA